MNYKPYKQDFKCDLKSGALSFLDLDKEQQPFEKPSKNSLDILITMNYNRSASQ